MTRTAGMLAGVAAAIAVAVVMYLGFSASGFFSPVIPPSGSEDTVAAPEPDAEASAEAVAVVRPEVMPTPETPAEPARGAETAPAITPETAAEDAGAPADAAAPPKAADDPSSEKDVTAAPEITAPTFDLVRVESDGATLVAGQGAADALVRILLDGDIIAEATVDRSGKFVSLIDLQPSPQPRLLALAMKIGDLEFHSETEVIVAPFGPKTYPEQVAEAKPTPVPAGETVGSTSVEPSVAPAVAETNNAAKVASGEPIALAPSQIDVADDSSGVQNGSISQAAAADTGTEVAKPAITMPDANETAAASAEIEEDARGEQVDTAAAEAAAPAEDSTSQTAEAPTPTPVPVTQDDGQIVASSTGSDGVTDAAEAPPKLLASDQEGVRVLQGPEILDQVSIDTISYDDFGEVVLSGRGVNAETGGFVRVYLDNSPVTTSRIQADGSWRVDLPEVDKGVYTLRVDEVDEAGRVTSRAETPFKREDPADLDRVANAGGPVGGPIRVVTVQPGNSLWQIARERYGEGLLYVRVFEANRGQIRDPDLIYPGQVFDLPKDEDAVEQ